MFIFCLFQTHMEELQRKKYKRKLFNNQGGRLLARSPDLQKEIAWRIKHLNHKWERLEHITIPRKLLYPDMPNVSLGKLINFNYFFWVEGGGHPYLSLV